MRKIYYLDGDIKPVEKEKICTRSKNEFKRYFSQKEILHQIDKTLLIQNREINFSIYIRKDFNYVPILMASESQPSKVTQEILDLQTDFLINHKDIPLYREFLESLGKEVSFTVDERTKATLIKESTKLTMRDILLDPRSGTQIKKAERAVEDMTSLFLSNKEIIYDLIASKMHDYYTYTHSVNVEVLTIGFGIALGLSRSDLFNLGIGALLHDIGKCNIPADILNKQDNLNEIEFNIVQKHVLEGGKILKIT
ncbi:MAG: HD domain-containing protein [Thermodesulfovibrionales bacterium]|nr:HD domain-containing protein [Thermodesulfovibrionales bacterium]